MEPDIVRLHNYPLDVLLWFHIMYVFILRWPVLEVGPLSRCELGTAYSGLDYYQLLYCRHLA